MNSHTPLEHAVDVTAGSAVDRDYEGTPQPSRALADAQAARRKDRALARLRAAADHDGYPLRAIVKDLLTVMGLEE